MLESIVDSHSRLGGHALFHLIVKTLFPLCWKHPHALVSSKSKHLKASPWAFQKRQSPFLPPQSLTCVWKFWWSDVLGLHTPWWTFSNNLLAPKMFTIVSLSWEKEDFSPFQYWRDLCESHLMKQCGQVGFLLCIWNDIFWYSKKHSPPAIDRTLVSNCKNVSPSSHTFNNHPRTLEQKV